MTARAIFVILAAATTAACGQSVDAPKEPERFKRYTLTVESSVGQARSGVIEDTQTGCLYAFADAQPITAVVNADGSHAGCRGSA